MLFSRRQVINYFCGGTGGEGGSASGSGNAGPGGNAGNCTPGDGLKVRKINHFTT
jgi:hypothetical protein